jgi:glycerol-3-phosphate O-acyltransferase
LLWLLLPLLALAAWALSRRWADRAARRAVRRFRARVDRFKLTGKRYIRTALLGDEDIAEAVRTHAQEHGVSEAAAWQRVRAYIDEIVPFFNILMYYEVGYALSRAVLSLFWKVTVEQEDAAALRALPRESIVIYLFNHRSNADYVLAGYALAGHVSISYAVGEWARVFPLEYLFKSFGSYFIRRRFREPLYHTVLERYVQLITRNGVTQGIFPEGGLSRDGRLRPAKVGLLDYLLGVAREPGFAERMYIIPVGLAYDRVLEDRTLLREGARADGQPVTGRVASLVSVLRYAGWNSLRLVSRRWQRYGRAVVRVGTPRPLHEFLTQLDAQGRRFNDLPRPERLARAQALADDVMRDIARLVPVTPVTLVCAALRTFPAEFVPRAALLERIDDLRDRLTAAGAAVVRTERTPAETFDVAYRMLRMRRVVARVGDGLLVLPHGRALIDYYANAIATFTDSLTFDPPRPL